MLEPATLVGERHRWGPEERCDGHAHSLPQPGHPTPTGRAADRRSDRAAGVLPVLVLQQALVELAGGVAGELGAEVDRAGALHVGQLRCGSRRSARARAPWPRRRRPASSTGCTTALTSSPKSSLGTPNTATSTTLGCVDEHVLGLLRVDVHPARDDHVRLAVGQVQEAVGVDVADVAERRPALRVPRALRLLGVVVVLELAATLEVDRARLALRAARRRSSSTMCTMQPSGAPDRARVGQPHLAVAVARSRCPRCRRSTRGDRTPPLDHLPLHRDRARRGGVHGDLQRRHVVAWPAPRRVSLSMRTNIVGTNWLCVTWYRSISASVCSGSKCSMTTTVPPSDCDRHAEAQRRGVVQRRGREVHRVRRRRRTAAAASRHDAGGGCSSGSGVQRRATPLGRRWCPTSRACRCRRRGRRAARRAARRRRPRRTRSRRSSPSSISRSCDVRACRRRSRRPARPCSAR